MSSYVLSLIEELCKELVCFCVWLCVLIVLFLGRWAFQLFHFVRRNA